MLREINQILCDSTCIWNLKKTQKSKIHRNKEQNDNCERQEVGKMGEDSQKIQTCGYKQFLGIC